MAQRMEHSQVQEQKMSPQLYNSLHLLSLPFLDLAAYVDERVLDNPLLEVNEDAGSAPERDSDEQTTQPENSGVYQDSLFLPNSKFNRSEQDNDEWSVEQNAPGSQPETDSLWGNLHLQLVLNTHGGVQERLGVEIIESIDCSGYFTGDLTAIAAECDTDFATAEAVLKLVQSFYPAGVGARSVSECLLLQLPPEQPYYQVLSAILQSDLAALAANKVGLLAEKYNLNKQVMQQLFDFIRSLNPRPGAEFDSGVTADYILPDIIIRKSDYGFAIIINDGRLAHLQVNKDYRSLLADKSLDNQTRDFISTKEREAQYILKSLGMRSQMLYRLAEYLIKAQRDFFESGCAQLIPMTMRQLAAELQVHPSTVSRAVAGKYIQTPWGIFPLKHFFATALENEDGAEISSNDIRQKISAIIQSEDSHKPYSDQYIADSLNAQGVIISRRTVAKYRQALNILGQSKRRRF